MLLTNDLLSVGFSTVSCNLLVPMLCRLEPNVSARIRTACVVQVVQGGRLVHRVPLTRRVSVSRFPLLVILEWTVGINLGRRSWAMTLRQTVGPVGLTRRRRTVEVLVG